jgi:hypothetical protein
LVLRNQTQQGTEVDFSLRLVESDVIGGEALLQVALNLPGTLPPNEHVSHNSTLLGAGQFSQHVHIGYVQSQAFQF